MSTMILDSRLLALCLVWFLAAFHHSSALEYSSQCSDMPLNQTNIIGQLSFNSSASGSSTTVTISRNPFIPNSVAGYRVVYTIEGLQTFQPSRADYLLTNARRGLESERQVKGLRITDPIPRGDFVHIDSWPDESLVWKIGQKNAETTQRLTYLHGDVAVEGARNLVRRYCGSNVKSYVFKLFDSRRSMELVAVGSLRVFR